MLKDSRELTKQDHKILVDIVNDSDTQHTIIPAGIFKIAAIRDSLKKGIKDKDKVIILTGSKRPLSLSDDTDAPFNLGYSFGKLGFLEPGVYVALNGRLFSDETQDEIDEFLK